MPVTVAPWLTAGMVAEQLDGVELDGGGALPPAVERHRAAAGVYVEGQRRDLFVDDGAGVLTFTPTPAVELGAAMLVARLTARKGSPQGLASFGEFGPAAVLRTDPDIERMCGIGRAARPVAR